MSEETKTRIRVQPVALSSAPHVNGLLSRLGLGQLTENEVSAYRGRNDNWSGTTTSGHSVFVKQIVGHPTDIQVRIHHLAAFDQLVSRHELEHLATPKLLGYDLNHQLVVHEHLHETVSAAELAADDAFTDDLAARTGKALAELHTLKVSRSHADSGTSPTPPVRGLEAIPVSSYADSSAGSIEAWSILHTDTEVAKAIAELADDAAAFHQPVHGDVRIDQVLWDGERLYVIDWEEFRLGDPARDIGAFAGEWLYRAVNGIPEKVSKEHPGQADYQPSDSEVIAAGTAELDRLRPITEAFWRGYRSIDSGACEELAVRAVRWAGWHMFDRMIALSEQSSRLPAISRAAAGIGRTALLSPEQFTKTIGLDV
ncbi:class V lanthionine synthetase subunit LxmK [Streptomyces sp. NPDC002550]